MRTPLSLPILLAIVLANVGCDAGVDFAEVVDGNSFGRAGSILTKRAQVIVDFSDADAVLLTAEIADGATVTDSADASCDRLAPEQGLFETRLPTDGCVFAFVVTSSDDELPDSPTELVIGFKNADDDGSVEIDPSLEVELPFPFSFADGYSRLTLVE